MRLQKFLDWSLPTKLALPAVVSLLAGPGFVGFLSEYAAYSYALHFGIRPPVEGIPYLRATVTLGTLVLLLACAIVFSATIWLFARFAVLVDQFFAMHKKDDGREMNIYKKAHPITQAVLLLASVLYGIAFATSFYRWLGWPDTYDLAVVIAGGIYGATCILVFMRPGARWWLGVGAVLTVIATCATLLFVPTKYALFLRWVGYGGGLPVRVDIRDDRLGSVTYDGYLMLRTSDAVILFRDAEMRFFEFPNAHIRGLSHPTGGLTSLPSKLPPAE